MTDIEKMSDLITNEFETNLLSLTVSPINKKEYVFFFVRSEGKIYLLHGSYARYEYIDLIRDTAPQNNNQNCSLSEVTESKEFIQLYRKRFLKKTELQDESVKESVGKICALDWATIKNDCYGFDGFSLSAYLPESKKTASFWCHYYSDANTPLATLTNYLLESVGVDHHYRFHQCND